MVKGLQNFKEFFKNYSDHYTIIGGTACSLNFENLGLKYRSTKDIDMVITVNVLSKEFVNKIFEYINGGGYQIQEKTSGKKIFYRFSKPIKEEYPEIIELFSGKPDLFDIIENQRIIPIITEYGVESLSALLLDKNYYEIIINRRKIIDGIPVVDEICLIILKIKAYLDLLERKRSGDKVDSDDINKHKKDVFRLYFALEENERFSVPEIIKSSIENFLKEIETDQSSLDSICNDMGVDNIKIQELIKYFEDIFLK
jgi:hypothetical protein